MLQKIRSAPLHEQVADQIREMIRKGYLRQGQKIAEAEFCRELGISRTPLREALRVLASEGLVQLTPNKGARISRPTLEEIRDMFQVMAVLEGLCAQTAATRRTEGDMARLDALHRALEEAYGERDEERYIQANHEYHKFVQSLAANSALSDIVNGLRQKIFLYRYRQLYQPGRMDDSIQEHRGLLEAFRRRDGASAEALMRHHLHRQCEALLRLYEAEGPQSPAPLPFPDRGAASLGADPA